VLAVIVSYKSAHLVRNLLVSLVPERQALAARGVTLRAVVIDNDSGDAEPVSAAVAELDAGSWIEVIRAERNGGFAYGNNVGFRHGFSSPEVPDFFFLLNPDTEVRPGAVGALVDFFAQHPDAGVAGSSMELADGQPWPYAFRYPSLLSELDHGLRFSLVSHLLRDHLVTRPMGNESEQVDWFPGAAMMIRRQVIEQIGGMDESYFLYFEETDYCRKVKAAGFSIWYVPASRIMHIVGQSTGVRTADAVRPRLPDYWFESRKRYFAKNHGLAYAMATDLVLVVAHTLGEVKEALKGKRHSSPPHFALDVLRHSVLLKANRSIAPSREWMPAAR